MDPQSKRRWLDLCEEGLHVWDRAPGVTRCSHCGLAYRDGAAPWDDQEPADPWHDPSLEWPDPESLRWSDTED